MGFVQQMNGDDEYVFGYNLSAVHILPIAMNLFSNIHLQKELYGAASSGGPGKITVKAHIFPFNNEWSQMVNDIFLAMEGYLFSPLVLLGSICSLLFLAFAGSEIVAHRECGVMDLLRLSGVGFWNFWSARFVYDLIHYGLIIGIFSIFIIQGYVLLVMMESISAKILFAIAVVLSVPQSLLFSYCLTFLFKRSASALVALMIIFVILPAIAYIVIQFFGASCVKQELKCEHEEKCDTKICKYYELFLIIATYFCPPFWLTSSAIQI